MGTQQATAVGMFGSLPSTTAAGGAQGGPNTLSQSDFLQLLVDQLQNQNPLNPMSSDSFMQEMATLTNVSAVTQMTTAITDLVDLTAASSALGLIGQSVTVTPANGPQVTGQVTGVEAGAGGPQVVIGGASYPLASVVAVGGATTSTTATTAAAGTAATSPQPAAQGSAP
jgi:flagellar basal-body rod modification protein FlgD